jgi:hypothetical protein
MTETIHELLGQINAVIEIFLNLHVLALFIINLTKTPSRALRSTNGYTLTRRAYRVIELLAGLITPLAKR